MLLKGESLAFEAGFNLYSRDTGDINIKATEI